MKRAFPYNKIIVIMLVIYSAIQIYCINQLSINYDEGSFASYGASLLKFQREKDVTRYESKLPVTALNMIPRAIEQLLNPNLKRNWPGSTVDIIRGRYISLLVFLLLGIPDNGLSLSLSELFDRSCGGHSWHLDIPAHLASAPGIY